MDPSHGIQHATSLQETDCDSFKWYISGLPTRTGQKCEALQAQTNKKCEAKGERGPHGILAPTFSREEEGFQIK